MLQIHTVAGLAEIETALRAAAARRGGELLAVTRFDRFLPKGGAAFTLSFPGIYAALLRAEIRFAAFLPSRIAACPVESGFLLDAVSPSEYCLLLRRPDLEPLAAGLERLLRGLLEDAARRRAREAAASTEDQVNMRAAVPQRIDRHGSKIEELAGTGVHDAQGG